MGELLFIATTVFVAYVVFVVLAEKKDVSNPEKPEIAKAEANKPVVMEKSEKIAPPSTVVKSAAKKPARSKPAAARPVTVNGSIKNPKTGEVAKIPASYSFAKRWIKDALVEEGLLEKVYKNNELDDDTTARIHAALQQLKAMEKYS
ncbi:MAG: hypothetical protein PHW13_07245 [Methylococcales bacterium]|nr:hypothetical protein [Methylococcales bacterium]